MAKSNAASKIARKAWLALLVGLIADTYRLLERSLASIAELLIRFWLAQVFFVSGVIKVSNWENALYLSANEYPVAWMDPVTAAYLGAATELICPIFLAFGLATRLAALPMLFLAAVIQFNYLALDSHLYWAVLLGWFVVRGAGELSLDHMLSRGLADSALPFAGLLVRVTGIFTKAVKPVYQFALRLWLGTALTGVGTGIATWQVNLLPFKSVAHLPAVFAIICALSFIFGFAVRPLALVIVLLSVGIHVMAGGDAADSYLLMLLSLMLLAGPGKWSLDGMIEMRLRQIFPQLEGKPAFALEGLPRVVIVGAGFGGLSCAAALARTPVQVTLIDSHNYHLFQPLLYQVATASLSPGDIATTVRSLFRDYFNVRVLLGTVTGVNTAKQEVMVGAQRIPYDYLVLATGATHSYFGREDWAPYAPGLKRIEDATEIRRRMLSAFERAEATDDPVERQSLLTFLIVGGGPTGVELSGAIAELARYGMEKEFRHFDPASARVMLVQAAPRILPTFPEKLSETAKVSLEKLGVEVVLNGRVEHIDEEGVVVSGKRISARTVLWAAGVVASPAARWLGAEADSAGRLKVSPDLSVAGQPEVFAIGDTALSAAWEGKAVPGLAPAAKQGGAYVAAVIRARVLGRAKPPPFTYKHLGSLATIGRKAAVADFGWLRLSGAPAWWLWGAVHVAFLVGMRNRISVLFDWFWAYLTFKGGTRLITGSSGRPEASE